MFGAAARSRGARRAPAALARAVPAHRTGGMAALCSVRDVIVAGRVVLAQGAVARIDQVLARADAPEVEPGAAEEVAAPAVKPKTRAESVPQVEAAASAEAKPTRSSKPKTETLKTLA